MSPRKVRLVVDLIRGLDVDDAEVQLQHHAKRGATPILKLLRSAIANAQHNFNLNRGNLFISEIRVDEGPTLKRFRPRAFGRAGTIRKRTSHIMLALEERKGAVPKKRKFTIREAARPKNADTLAELEKPSDSVAEERERTGRSFAPEKKKTTMTKRITDISKRFFRRKSV